MTTHTKPFKKEFFNEAYHVLLRLGIELGDSFDIPPKTASVIIERRKTANKLRMLIDDSRVQHIGWGMACPQVAPIDSLTYVMLWKELSEIHKLPMGFFSCLALQIRSDPGIMKVYNRGIQFFFLDQHNNPTSNESQAVKATPHFLRAAWDGAIAGYWDMEDVLLLPSGMKISIEELNELEGWDIVNVGAEAYFA